EVPSVRFVSARFGLCAVAAPCRLAAPGSRLCCVLSCLRLTVMHALCPRHGQVIGASGMLHRVPTIGPLQPCCRPSTAMPVNLQAPDPKTLHPVAGVMIGIAMAGVRQATRR